MSLLWHRQEPLLDAETAPDRGAVPHVPALAGMHETRFLLAGN